MLQTANIVRELEGVQTDVLLQAYADRTLVLVTQLGKVGSLIQATIPSTMPLLPPPPPDPENPNVIPLPVPPPSLQLMPLLGSAPSDRVQTLHALYASQIATLVWTMEEASVLEADRRPVVVGIALAKTSGPPESSELGPRDRAVFYGVMDLVRELLARK
ncbi:hypothetical protein BD309DRAFT_948143 [Dichomitus squalens]|uniref:Proteasome assembly chaperone 3 n=1 Tax=Dichomitus squalens TaxID=114155 RepID=A0A4Q9N6M4_9APHY|nr:uncharacterized protein DICSQDRAFT_97872 [Dichomitus squalens LYAD-421 SS1]EJF66086.1 hypothetical protein DICSQDRAFT_97872 [Dichomitus squalens LYAD-421 SS1]TBU35718.1 hypothetical protein BD311DRAFT_744477 [Dichomitus squalens]TBU49126.1 hypothetical protein BD309DRAFT_948143 [Dichomitus squalens]TBU65564.1 hypothetical protein BD310DRAFT_804329 [Dichomitus squalens]